MISKMTCVQRSKTDAKPYLLLLTVNAVGFV